MGFSRQGYWRGLPCPPPGNLPNPGIKPESLITPALAGRFFTTSSTWEVQKHPMLFMKKMHFISPTQISQIMEKLHCANLHHKKTEMYINNRLNRL